jgi:hypothetical protein
MLRLACALLLAASAEAGARERLVRPEPPRHEPYQADALDPVRSGVPGEVELLRAPDAKPWPDAMNAELSQRVRAEWPTERVYGPVFANLGVTLRWPLVTAEAGGRVIVPFVEGLELPIEGALDLARSEGPRSHPRCVGQRTPRPPSPGRRGRSNACPCWTRSGARSITWWSSPAATGSRSA